MKTIAQLTKSPNFWVVDRYRDKIAPFPGKYPTRWRVTILGQDSKLEARFISKPSVTVMNRVLRRGRRPGGIELTEFDRLGALRASWHVLPRANFKVQGAVAGVTSTYYPWHSTIDDFFWPWKIKLYFTKVILGKRTFFIYSPYHNMMETEEHQKRLRDYRTWLRKINPWSK